MKTGAPANSNNASDLVLGKCRWQLRKMLHQFRERAEEVIPNVLLSRMRRRLERA